MMVGLLEMRASQIVQKWTRIIFKPPGRASERGSSFEVWMKGDTISVKLTNAAESSRGGWKRLEG